MMGRAASRVNVVAAGLVAVIAGVHFQQYVDFISEVPTIGVLFLLNAAGGAGLAVALVVPDRPVRILAAAGALALATGSLISIVVALSGHLFGYQEPTLRVPIVLAVVAEVAALPALTVALLRERSASRR